MTARTPRAQPKATPSTVATALAALIIVTALAAAILLTSPVARTEQEPSYATCQHHALANAQTHAQRTMMLATCTILTPL